MAKKSDNSVPVVQAPQSANTPTSAQPRIVEYIVLDGKIVPDNHPGVVR